MHRAALVVAVSLLLVLIIAAPLFLNRGPVGPQAELPDNGLPTLVEFHSRACEICRMMRPGIRKLESEFGEEMNFVYLDVNDRRNSGLTRRFDVYGLPAIVILNAEGEALDIYEGQVGVPFLRKAIEEALEAGEKVKEGLEL